MEKTQSIHYSNILAVLIATEPVWVNKVAMTRSSVGRCHRIDTEIPRRYITTRSNKAAASRVSRAVASPTCLVHKHSSSSLQIVFFFFLFNSVQRIEHELRCAVLFYFLKYFRIDSTQDVLNKRAVGALDTRLYCSEQFNLYERL